MEKLWAPWRSKYIYRRQHGRCIFCGTRRPHPAADRKRYILARSRHAFSILNLYPYTNGHVMVAPFRHVKSIELLTAAEMADLMQLVASHKRLLDKHLKPDGYNIGMNIGKIGGAGFDGHCHIHIVPRWAGDTNFMPIIAGTKIVSESLEAMYRLLKGRC